MWEWCLDQCENFLNLSYVDLYTNIIHSYNGNVLFWINYSIFRFFRGSILNTDIERKFILEYLHNEENNIDENINIDSQNTDFIDLRSGIKWNLIIEEQDSWNKTSNNPDFSLFLDICLGKY